VNIDDYLEMKQAEGQQSKEDQVETPETKPIEEIKETKPVEDVVQEEPKVTIPDKVAIEGIGEVELDELKKGYLRQSDYTRKTQDLAKQRDETKDAIEVFTYLKNNPDIAQKLAEYDKERGTVSPAATTATPAVQKQKDLERQLFDLQLQMQIQGLQSKYDDFDVKEVMDMSIKEGIVDLEKAYKLVKADKISNTSSTLDEKALREKIKAELEKEYARNADTDSLITKKGTKKPVEETRFQWSADEDKVRQNMNMTQEEWEKWRNHK